MDPQIEELKELIRQNTALTGEVHAMVKSMRRGALISTIMRFAWIGLIVAVSIGTFVYFAPYLQQIQALYDSIQEALQQAQQISSQFQNPNQ